MKKPKTYLTEGEILRQKAEEQLKMQQSKVSLYSSENDMRKLLHELQVHQIELEMQNEEKEKRADELIITNKELAFQNDEKEKRAAELIIANKELTYQNGEKEKRAAELIIANEELTFQIIERNQAEEALRESEEKFKFYTDNSPMAVVEWDSDFKVKRWTGDSEKIFGWNSEEVVGKKIMDLHIIYEPDIPMAQNTVEKLTSGLFKQVISSNRNYRKDRSIINCEWYNTILKNQDGEMLSVLSKVLDITERKRTQEVLESQYLLLTAMINSPSDIIIFSLDNNYCYTAFNEKHREEMGKVWDADIMIGMNLLDCMSIPEIREIAKKSIDRALSGEEFTEIQLQPDFDIYYELSWNPIFQNKLIVGVVVFTRDITDRIQAEAELIKAKGQAVESDRLKSAFLTNMSHEIRTPMNGILGFAELLKEPNLSSDDMQDYIQTIQISGARMLNTINNIVDFSKIESGLMKVDIKESNINDQIEFLYAFFKPEVESKGMQIFFKNGLPSKEAIIKTDLEIIYAILTNLIKNAIKFTNEGLIEFGYEKKGKYLEFFVKDTGVGIPEKQKKIIFERFRQGSESHNRGYEGSGLGLSICKSYVEMLEGRIWVESEEGLGSTFYFTIPYNAVSDEKIEIINAISAEHKEVQIKKLKILIVEDDEISNLLLAKMLQKISYEVLHAITGVQAIELCNNNPDLDLVLMDIKMPDMDGLKATRQIRQFNKDVIIIVQTAYGFSGDREKAIEAGCNDYISKPINNTSLFELIKKHINK